MYIYIYQFERVGPIHQFNLKIFSARNEESPCFLGVDESQRFIQAAQPSGVAFTASIGRLAQQLFYVWHLFFDSFYPWKGESINKSFDLEF